ncbi:MAG TPA: TlpA disulfide reductase family protein [Bdellovibrionales bacterium]|nr:TlpA disulfide reductase family protein [Bdellovibrionales bacterium]
MNIYLKGLLSALALAAVLLGGWFYYSHDMNAAPEGGSLTVLDRLEKEGIPAFELPDMNGAPIKAESFKGKVVVLNFWATWCAPCVEEFPSMIKMADHFGGKVLLVTIAADERKEDIERFVSALKLKSDHWVALWDPENRVAKQFGTVRLPETYILNKDLKLVKKVVNSLDWSAEPVLRYLSEVDSKR